MNVHPNDGRCRECGGCLEITDADEVTLAVRCLDCHESYFLEPDAFVGSLHCWREAILRKLDQGDDPCH